MCFLMFPFSVRLPKPLLRLQCPSLALSIKPFECLIKRMLLHSLLEASNILWPVWVFTFIRHSALLTTDRCLLNPLAMVKENKDDVLHVCACKVVELLLQPFLSLLLVYSQQKCVGQSYFWLNVWNTVSERHGKIFYFQKGLAVCCCGGLCLRSQ